MGIPTVRFFEIGKWEAKCPLVAICGQQKEFVFSSGRGEPVITLRFATRPGILEPASQFVFSIIAPAVFSGSSFVRAFRPTRGIAETVQIECKS